MPRIKQATPVRLIVWLVLGAALVALSIRSFIIQDTVTGVASMAGGVLFGGVAVLQIIQGRRQK
ncbi:hypothetical protein [Actinomyces sp. 2119]|uniref:hypothetical protein n=1 Tax=Actinomyces sp. 2119 TaxID=2321393 RepID=UPI0011C45F51|nr:hypothetical protein [Actinomyces sp. 2119]